MRSGREVSKRVLAVAALLAAIGAATQASAGSIQRSVTNPNVSIETIVQFGNDVQPVTIEENSRVNIARVIQIGGS
jgi:minor curlin subunit